jgi:hypothetical protein
MKRRDALRGIIGFTTVGLISYHGLNYFNRNNLTDVNDITEYSDLIIELTEVIIPTTSTLGAKKAQVSEYIIGYMRNCSRKKDYNNFVKGLINIEKESFRRFKQSFKNCTSQEKYGLITDLDRSSKSQLLQKINNKIWGKSFFDLLQSLTGEGYCTSRIGVTEFLNYQPIPGKYQAITSYNYGQKAWSTK